MTTKTETAERILITLDTPTRLEKEVELYGKRHVTHQVRLAVGRRFPDETVIVTADGRIYAGGASPRLVGHWKITATHKETE